MVKPYVIIYFDRTTNTIGTGLFEGTFAKYRQATKNILCTRNEWVHVTVTSSVKDYVVIT